VNLNWLRAIGAPRVLTSCLEWDCAPRNVLEAASNEALTHPPSTPQHPHDGRHFASIYEMRHAPHFASTLDESRRTVVIRRVCQP